MHVPLKMKITRINLIFAWLQDKYNSQYSGVVIHATRNIMEMIARITRKLYNRMVVRISKNIMVCLSALLEILSCGRMFYLIYLEILYDRTGLCITRSILIRSYVFLEHVGMVRTSQISVLVFKRRTVLAFDRWICLIICFAV